MGDRPTITLVTQAKYANQLALVLRDLRRLGFEPVVAVVMAAQEATGSGKPARLSGKFCPDCGMALVLEEGSEKCFSCGFSRT